MSQDMIFVNINSEDIANGMPGNAFTCAISKAAKRKFNTNDAGTTYDTLRIGNARYKPVNRARYRRFLAKFDARKKVEPTRFYFKKETC